MQIIIKVIAIDVQVTIENFIIIFNEFEYRELSRYYTFS